MLYVRELLTSSMATADHFLFSAVEEALEGPRLLELALLTAPPAFATPLGTYWAFLPASSSALTPSLISLSSSSLE